MNDSIKLLLDIRSEDLEILTLREDLAHLRKNIEDCEANRENLRRQIQQIDESVVFQKSQKDLQELDLNSHQEHIDNLQKSLKEARNNKEYININAQVKSRMAQKKMVEDEILKIMELIEQHQEKKAEIDKKITENDQEIKEIETNIADQIKSIQEGIDQHQKSKDLLTEKLDQDLRSDYERLFERYQGEAICESDESTCSGCYITLSSEYANKIRLGNELVHCPSCGRIIYLSPV